MSEYKCDVVLTKIDDLSCSLTINGVEVSQYVFADSLSVMDPSPLGTHLGVTITLLATSLKRCG